MKIDILTLFPDMFAPLEHSIVGKAQEKGLLEINYHNFRENAEKARHVDDEPYGGGQGMLLRAQPIFDTFDKLQVTKPRVILLDPAGRTFDQAYAEELAQEEELVFICGHYEGYDERIKTLVTDEISLGDPVRFRPSLRFWVRKPVIRMIVFHQGFWSFHSIRVQLNFVA